jgi:hypothetical protein
MATTPIHARRRTTAPGPRVHFVWLAVASVALMLSARVSAEEVFRYPEVRHGRGELKYINEIPVLIVAGSPEEMGEQLGALALKPATPLTKAADELVAHYGWQQIYRLVLKSGNLMMPSFPPEHAQEVEAAAKTSGWPRDLLVFGNTILDLRRIIQCSTIIVEEEHTATGGPLFGRNLDWPSVAKLHEYTFVTVYRPNGKRSFASITFPGVLGCTTGINDAGLAIAMLDVEATKDGATGLNPRGTPTVFALRRIMEECATVDDALALLRSVERASLLNVAICDRERGAVLEVTPKNVILRPSESGFCLCTNHFRSIELGTSKECWRYEILLKSIGSRAYSVSDIAERLHAVNQGDMTLQSMVFEPRTLTLHLAFGAGPATRLPLKRLDLAKLFHPQPAAPAERIGP